MYSECLLCGRPGDRCWRIQIDARVLRSSGLMRKPVTPTCCVLWLCHLTPLESVAYVSRQMDFQLPKTEPRIMLIYSSCHQQWWSIRNLSCVQGLDCYIYTGTWGKSNWEHTFSEGRLTRRESGQVPRSWPHFQNGPPEKSLWFSLLRKGAERPGVFSLCSSLHWRNHQNGKKGKDLPLPTAIWWGHLF